MDWQVDRVSTKETETYIHQVENMTLGRRVAGLISIQLTAVS
jgi:hypothetical protein